MHTIEKKIDINAHIANLEYTISTEVDSVKVSVSFDNLGYGVVKAIKFRATGYNSFGDNVLVNGEESFFIIMQDINISKNEHATGLIATLPSNEIRKIDLEEYQVCYCNDAVETYKGKDIRHFRLEAFDVCGDEADILSAINDKFEKGFECLPQETDCGWICGCGRYNRANDTTCTNCKNARSEVLKLNDAGYIEDLVKQHKKKEEERKEKERQEELKAKKKQIHKNICTCIGMIIVFALIGCTAYLKHKADVEALEALLAQRTVYASEVEMKDAVCGVYTAKEDNNRYDQIKINEDCLILKYELLGDECEDKRSLYEWNPGMGTIGNSGDIIVTKTGDIEYDGELYTKGGTWKPAQGMKFKSKDSMKTTVQGIYTLYIGGIKKSEIKIDGDNCICTYYNDSGESNSYESAIINWNHDTGEFETGTDIYVVRNDLSISNCGLIYERFGTATSGLFSSSYESIYDALELSDVKIEHNSSYTVCTGSIKNTGKTTYCFVEIKGAFKNSSGDVLDSDWTYLVGKEGIAPGESKTFRMSVSVNRNIKSCSVSVIDYQ